MRVTNSDQLETDKTLFVFSCYELVCCLTACYGAVAGFVAVVGCLQGVNSWVFVCVLPL